jgi:hypothetical protein
VWSRDISVGTATGCGPDDKGVGVPSPGEVKKYFFSAVSRPALELTQPPIQWVAGDLSLGIKRPVREADHSNFY